jgi:hypothetical protein
MAPGIPVLSKEIYKEHSLSYIRKAAKTPAPTRLHMALYTIARALPGVKSTNVTRYNHVSIENYQAYHLNSLEDTALEIHLVTEGSLRTLLTSFPTA